MWRYVLFDLGDTLVDSHPLTPAQMDRLIARGFVVWLRRRTMRAADEFSPDERARLGEMTGARLVEAAKQGLEEISREYWSQGLEPPVATVFAKLQSELAAFSGIVASASELEEVFLKAQLSRQRVLPGAPELLAELRAAGLRLGLVSNCVFSREPMDAYLRGQGLAEHFSVVVFSSDLGQRKPKPLPFQTALDRLGGGVRDAVFVGDDLRTDIAGAAAAGMAAIWYWGHRPELTGLPPAGGPVGAGSWPDLEELPDLAAALQEVPSFAGAGAGGIVAACRDYAELKRLITAGPAQPPPEG